MYAALSARDLCVLIDTNRRRAHSVQMHVRGRSEYSDVKWVNYIQFSVLFLIGTANSVSRCVQCTCTLSHIPCIWESIDSPILDSSCVRTKPPIYCSISLLCTVWIRRARLHSILFHHKNTDSRSSHTERGMMAFLAARSNLHHVIFSYFFFSHFVSLLFANRRLWHGRSHTAAAAATGLPLPHVSISIYGQSALAQ